MPSFRIRAKEWENFAKEDPFQYICTGLPPNGAKAFWRSGEEIVDDELVPLVARYELRPQMAMEFGCGVGRLVLPLTRYFQAVVGLDIASTMVTRATSAAAQRGITNANFVTIQDPVSIIEQLGQYRRKVDLIYSLLVFQHIDDFNLIAVYVKSICDFLNPNGIAYLQFDTRPASAFCYAREFFPDSFLPRYWRRGIRRIRRTPQELEACFRRHSLMVVDSLGSRTEYHRYIVRPQKRVESD